MTKPKILVVDDELDMRTFVSTLLKTHGYSPVMANDGSEGLKKAKKVKPSLIILDVMMPKESGIKMYQHLKMDEELKDIPVIILSAIAKKSFLHSVRMLEPIIESDAYLEKPPESQEILETIENILANRAETKGYAGLQ